MINTYRLNPDEYLTVTACRRNLTGDVCAIIRVHAFLEQWGLINHQVDPDTRPSPMGPSFTAHFEVTAEVPEGLELFRPTAIGAAAKPGNAVSGAGGAQGGQSGQVQAQSGVGSSVAAPRVTGSLDFKGDIFATGGSASANVSSDRLASVPAGKRDSVHCWSCGVLIAGYRYHAARDKPFDLCANCFLEGRFPHTMFSGDFVRMHTAAMRHDTQDAWTEQEVFLLLEGIEMFQEDWNKVAEHVGTRTREQCLLHFLQLPIEDPFLEPASAPIAQSVMQQGGGGNLSGSMAIAAAAATTMPFTRAENPVMTVMAFLASSVSPNVAACAAQAALRALAEERKARLAAPQEDGKKGDKSDVAAPQQDKKDEKSDSAAPQEEKKEDDAMEVDSEKPADPAHVAPSESAQLRAAGAAFGAAAARALTLAEIEERRMQREVAAVVELQLRKLEIKLAHFETMETQLETERRHLARHRTQLAADRVALQKQIETFNAAAAAASAAVGAQNAIGGQVVSQQNGHVTSQVVSQQSVVGGVALQEGQREEKGERSFTAL